MAMSPNKLQLSREEMKEIFREFDMDGDCVLSVREVSQAFCFMGCCNPLHKAWYALKYADADGDGCITEDELDKLIDYAMKPQLKRRCNDGKSIQ